MALETHDVGRLYWHTMAVPTGGPLVELGQSHEVEEPWRVGRCVVLRVWRRALVVGWWGRGRSLAEVVAAEKAELDLQREDWAKAKPLLDQIRDDFRPQPVEEPEDTEWRVV